MLVPEKGDVVVKRFAAKLVEEYPPSWFTPASLKLRAGACMKGCVEVDGHGVQLDAAGHAASS